jgi:Putative MetA-pathway of phenol degradation
VIIPGRIGVAVVAFLVCAAAFPAPAGAQQTITSGLSFLLTNRSIPTGDFARDEAAAAATRDTISTFLRSALTTLPVTSSASGFTYRIAPELGGVPVRSTNTFGAFFTERSITIGQRQLSLAATYQGIRFDEIDGRNLRDGTLRATASRLTLDQVPFDVETVAMRIRTDIFTVAANYGVTERLELGAALPLERVTLTGERVDTYRGTPLLQAAVSANASGVGDMVVRGKVNLLQRGAAGMAIGAEGRLPTGNSANLLGAGEASVKPHFMVSMETSRIAVDGSAGYMFGGVSDELDYSAAVTSAGAHKITIVGEVAGRRLNSAGHLIEVISRHPVLAGVETVRLSAVEQATNRVVAVAGVKWNARATWLVTANVARSLTSSGLTARWMSTIGAEYAFGE